MLVICDSHGTKWGALGYAWQLKKKLGTNDVDIIEYGGISIQKIPFLLKESIQNSHYTHIIIGLGNVDVHPRMPLNVMKFCRKIKLFFIREGLFSVPPTLNLYYIIRLPFFILKLIIIRFFKQTYLSNDEIRTAIENIYIDLKDKGEYITILPLFEVNEIIYTNYHNIQSKNINSWLMKNYKNIFFDDQIVEKHFYKNYYNYDFFHFKTEYHNMLSDLLITKIIDRQI